MELTKFLKLAKGKKKTISRLFKQLGNLKNNELDALFHNEHETVFSQIDCLDCANCCKTISPIVTDKDIHRIAALLKTKPGKFVEKYLKLDSDNDYVFTVQPCPFLLEDNKCSIYDVRPKACREYPHTDRAKMFQILKLTQKNCFVCPAVSIVINRLNKKINGVNIWNE